MLGAYDSMQRRRQLAELQDARGALATGQPMPERRGVLGGLIPGWARDGRTPGINPEAPDVRTDPGLSPVLGRGDPRETLARYAPTEFAELLAREDRLARQESELDLRDRKAVREALATYAPEMFRHGQAMSELPPEQRQDYWRTHVAPGMSAVGLGQLAAAVGAEGIDDDDIAGMVSMGGAFGGRPDERASGAPSSVEEYEYFQGLDEDARRQFLDLKRNSPGIPDRVLGAIMDASDSAQSSFGRAARYESLADQFENTPMPDGVRGSLSEMFKAITGDQDEITRLRQEYSGLRASEVVANLPPGAASDKDIELALSGFPAENADPEYIASFLRGVARIQKLEAEYNAFKADFLSREGTPVGLRRAWAEHSATMDFGPSDPYGLGI